jgi:hypothetical protein
MYGEATHHVVRRFEALQIKKAATHRLDDGGSTDLWNTGKLIPVYTLLTTAMSSVIHTITTFFLEYEVMKKKYFVYKLHPDFVG